MNQYRSKSEVSEIVLYCCSIKKNLIIVLEVIYIRVTNEWINKFYFASEGIHRDMGYKKYKLNELQYIKLD